VTFIEALPAAFEGGERIRREVWPSGVYCVVVNKQLCINWSNGAISNQWHAWVISEDDYLSDDWSWTE
jgi:hypothetical protein